MAAPYQIVPPAGILPGNPPLDFADWQGPAPSFVHEQGVEFVKPGADGTGLQKTGKHHPAIEAVLTSHHQSWQVAIQKMQAYVKLPHAGLCDVRWKTIDFSPFNVALIVTNVDILQDSQPCIHLLHADYDYANGGKLVTRWRFIPVER